jgi:cysteine desulfurase
MNGFGILVKKKNVNLKPQINGGKSTTIFRSGTPELANIVACDKALDIALKNMSTRYEYIKSLSKQIKDKLKEYKNVHLNTTDNSIPHIINFSLKGKKASDIQKKLEQYDVYVSTKTSCCPIQTPSKLVYALTKDKGLSSSSIRVSLSHLTTTEEINEFLKIFDLIYKESEKNGEF